MRTPRPITTLRDHARRQKEPTPADHITPGQRPKGGVVSLVGPPSLGQRRSIYVWLWISPAQFDHFLWFSPVLGRFGR